MRMLMLTAVVVVVMLAGTCFAQEEQEFVIRANHRLEKRQILRQFMEVDQRSVASLDGDQVMPQRVMKRAADGISGIGEPHDGVRTFVVRGDRRMVQI